MSVGTGSNAFKANLAQALNAGGSETTIYLDSITTLTGETLVTADFAVFGKGTVTIDPLNSSSMEFASFTAVDSTNIAFTGLIRGLSAFDSTASTSRAFYHPVGTTVIIAFGVHDLQNFKTYVDGVLAGTVGNASASVYGVSKLSLAPVSASAPIAVGDNDTRIPTANQAAALSSTTSASASNLFISQKDFQKGAEIYAADAGSTDDYVITASPVPAAYTTGMSFRFKANTVNTGAATLNVNGLGAKTIKKNFNLDLTTGDIVASQIVAVIYDGTNFQMLSPFVNNPKSGATTKNLADASAVQNIAHGLGSTPKLVRVRGVFSSNQTGQGTQLISMSTTVYTASQSSDYLVISTGEGATSSSSTHGAAFRIYSDYSGGGANYQEGVVTVDATNIIITWTKNSTPTGTANLIYEASL